MDRDRSAFVTAIPTSIDRAVDTPVPAGGLRVCSASPAGSAPSPSRAPASGPTSSWPASWVRAALVALWGLAAVDRGRCAPPRPLAAVIAGAAVAGGVCTVTAVVGRPQRRSTPRRRASSRPPRCTSSW